MNTVTIVIPKYCNCEHAAHFGDCYTPNGNPAHKYGKGPYVKVAVKTPYGTFYTCKDCANDCYLDFPRTTINTSN